MSRFSKPLDMISSLIEIPSVSSTLPTLDMGNIEVIDLLANWLDDLSFDIEIQHLKDQPNKANLIATLGKGEQGLVLAGHADTVPYDQNTWNFDPFRATESENRIYGLGTSDMKSFLALAVVAASQFRKDKLKQPLRIVATADEETSMEGAEAISKQNKKLGRYCLIGEPTNLIPVRQHKGILMEGIRLIGLSGHSSDPRLGRSALEGMHTVIQALIDYRSELTNRYQNSAFTIPTPTLNFGYIHGGDNPNRICAECELHLDLRPLPGMEIDELRHTLRKRVSRVAKRLNLECQFENLFDGIPAMETPPNAHIVKFTEHLCGHRSEAVSFGTEGPYYNRLGMETVILGPGNIDQAHQPNEYLELDRIRPTLVLLNKLIQRFCISPD